MIIKDDKNQVAVKQDTYITELKNTQEACTLLMKTPHYARMGKDGIFAIIETAKSLNIDPRQALGGGLYFVKGKVEVSSRMMAALIRSKKHSITRDSKSNDTICILHGKRADTNDCWTESFSIDEAKRAGIYKNAWITFPRDMLYARALSRLARQLFPDIIGNCYVEGEIKDDPNINDTYQNDNQNDSQTDTLVVENKRSKEQIEELIGLFNYCPDYREEIEAFLEKRGLESFEDMPEEMYDKVLIRAKQKAEAKNENNKV